MLKPHLFVPFGVVLILWAIRTRGYKVLAGVSVSLIVSTLAVMVIDPQGCGAGLHANDENGAGGPLHSIPCVSVILRQWVTPHTVAIQCLPVALGCGWAVYYFLKHRDNWN